MGRKCWIGDTWTNSDPASVARSAGQIFLMLIAINTTLLINLNSILAEEFECINPENRKGEYRIVGGRDADLARWPFLVGLISEPGGDFICGGSLINRQWVVTAAHCVTSGRTPIGAARISVRQPTAAAQLDGRKVRVSKVLPSPHYDSSAMKNDIALLKLANSVEIDSSQLAMLATGATQATWGSPGTCAAVAGWGLIHKSPDLYPKRLKDLNVLVWSQADCQGAYPLRDIVPDSHLCAGYRTLHKDSCNGDSGGPLISRYGPTDFLLIGTVSFGDEQCGKANKPGVYAPVAPHRDWIFTTMRANP